VEQFSKNPQYKELLAGVTFRAPDIVFDREATLDFGGVTARLMWMGAAHTLGRRTDYSTSRTSVG